jgi:hypothetical protein
MSRITRGAFAAHPAEHLAIRLTPVGRVIPSSTIGAVGSSGRRTAQKPHSAMSRIRAL